MSKLPASLVRVSNRRGNDWEPFGDQYRHVQFPISRDPPEGGTSGPVALMGFAYIFPFPISRDPPEGGTHWLVEDRYDWHFWVSNF